MTAKPAPDLNVDELACRIAEAIIGIPRPVGSTPERALAHLTPRDRAEFKRGARAAIAFLTKPTPITDESEILRRMVHAYWHEDANGSFRGMPAVLNELRLAGLISPAHAAVPS